MAWSKSMRQPKLNTKSCEDDIPTHQQQHSQYNIIFYSWFSKVFLILFFSFFCVAMIEIDPLVSVSMIQERISSKRHFKISYHSMES